MSEEYDPVNGREGRALVVLLAVVVAAAVLLAWVGLLRPATIEDLLWLGGAR